MPFIQFDWSKLFPLESTLKAILQSEIQTRISSNSVGVSHCRLTRFSLGSRPPILDLISLRHCPADLYKDPVNKHPTSPTAAASTKDPCPLEGNRPERKFESLPTSPLFSPETFDEVMWEILGLCQQQPSSFSSVDDEPTGQRQGLRAELRFSYSGDARIEIEATLVLVSTTLESLLVMSDGRKDSTAESCLTVEVDVRGSLSDIQLDALLAVDIVSPSPSFEGFLNVSIITSPSNSTEDSKEQGNIGLSWISIDVDVLGDDGAVGYSDVKGMLSSFLRHELQRALWTLFVKPHEETGHVGQRFYL